MKKLSVVFFVLAGILSHVMCAVVAYEYRGMLCCIRHVGCSAPASVAFFYFIPFGLGIILCLVVGLILRRKSRKVV